METKGNGHKSNWLVILKNHMEGIKGPGWVDENLVSIYAVAAAIETKLDTPANFMANLTTLETRLSAARAALLDEITALRMAELDPANIPGNIDTLLARVTAAVALASSLTTHDTDIKALLGTIAGYIDTEIGAIETKLDTPANFMADVSALALEATLTAIKGGGWTTETLKAIKDAIDAIAGVDSYQEQIPDTDFDLAAIDDTLTADPPNADAENSVVDIDQNAGDTFVLRSLWVKITDFGTNGTKLTFALWVPVNAVVTKVDEVDVVALGIQNLMDLFGLQEVHADGIWITVLTDGDSADAACEGTYRYAKAS